MDNNEKLSRANRHHNRRNNNKILLFFIGLAVIFVVILISLITFGGDSKDKKSDPNNANKTSDVNNNDDNSSGNTTNNTDEIADDVDESNDEIDVTGNTTPLEDYKIDAPDLDDNIIEVYSGNWPPIGTEQTGDHVTVYTNDSADRIEIKKAASMVTGIAEDEMVEWFVGNGGDHQTAVASISDKSETAYYKVYLSWIDEQGWQVTLVEKVKSVQ